MKIRSKILLLLLGISVVTLSAIGLVAYTLGRSALEAESFNKLTAVRELKAGQIEDYFQLISDQVVTLSEDRMIIEAVQAFDEGLHMLEEELELTTPDLAQIDSALGQYYQDEYLDRLIPNLLKDVSIDNYWPEEKGRVLQGLYITSNPFETGQKYLLDNALDGSSYSTAHEIYHPIIRDYLERFGYYDIFLVDINTGGHIVYTVFKEVDFGTSLTTGPYKNTNFARAFQAARDATDKDFVYLEDFEPYHPSYNAPAAFIASPIFDGDEKVGVLVFQMPIDRINDIMINNQQWADVGLGESGETYIVGEDFLLRNQSRFLIEDSLNYFKLLEETGSPLTIIAQIRNLNSTIGLQEVRTQGTEAALRGETGTATFPDYRGISVLSAYKPLNIQDVNWVIMSEIDEAEAFSYIRILGTRTLLVALVIFLATALASLVFSRSLTSPLAALTRNSKEVAAGNLDVEIEYLGHKDEIGGLAKSFHTMQGSIRQLVGELEEINQDLEQRVEERTKDLELSERKSGSIIETAGEGIIVADHESKVILWNQSSEKMFGYTSEEMLGKPITEIMPARYASPHFIAVDRANDAGQLAHPGKTHELAGIRKDGTEFPMELVVSQWSIAGATYYSGILRDITERKRLEAEILQQKEMLETTIESLTHPFYVINVEDYSLAIVNSAAKQLGLSEETRCYALTHRRDAPCDSKEDPCPLVEVKKTKKPFTVEHIHFDKEGNEIFVEVHGYPIFDSDGNVIQMIEYSLDITDRKMAEKTIRDREARLSAFTSALPDLAFIINEDGRNVAILSAEEEHLLTPSEEIVGTLFHDTLSKDLADRFLDLVQTALATGETQSTEFSLKVPAGKGWYEVRCAPILDTLGEKRLVVWLSRDITERKRMEAQLETANERMSEELNFAREIQQGLLPLIFPAFPTRSEFSIFASLIPAREVGGDFYDFYFLDENHLCFVIGDVSGKGAPGALLMAVSKTLIKSRAMDDFEPSSILTHVNTELSQNNESAMFVTVFLGILDIRTGKVEYTNAGHNPPFIKRKDGTVLKLDDFHGPVVGALPNLHYKESSTVLEQDDIIVLFTDGITESMNIKDELYSDEHFEQFLESEELLTPQKLIDVVVRDVKRHEGEAEQADDITILALKFTGQTKDEVIGRLDIKMKNQISQLAVVEEQFESFCQEYDIQDNTRQQVSMVLDEMLNNVVNYAYRDEEEHIIDLEFVLSGTRLVITMRDDGVPFNPFALDPPNIALSLDERDIGGLGIFLVRGVMDEYLYTRHIGRNVVTLVKLIEKE